MESNFWVLLSQTRFYGDMIFDELKKKIVWIWECFVNFPLEWGWELFGTDRRHTRFYEVSLDGIDIFLAVFLPRNWGQKFWDVG